MQLHKLPSNYILTYTTQGRCPIIWTPSLFIATAKVKSLTRPRKALLGKVDYIKQNRTK